MKKILYVALVAAIATAMGCAITNYPVMFDTRGADLDQIVDSFYDKAYIVPSGQTATIWDDGTDELYTQVAQTWTGDQKLYTFNNFDPSGAITFLDQTYCDSTRQSDCATVVADNPDLPEAYSFGSSPINATDDPFDYTLNDDCSGARSLSLLVSYTARIGECGDGFMADKQGMASVFSNLDTTTWRGETAYVLPINAANMTVNFTSATDAVESVPVFGSYTGLVTDRLQLAIPMTPNARHQLNHLRGWVAENGSDVRASIQYEGVNADLELNLVPTGLANNAGRF